MTNTAVKILCVDDEDAIRQDIVEELRDAGYQIVEACDGLDGFEAILREEPDLVVSDMTMPRLDGHGLLQKLRDECPDLAELPFIFLSALSDRKHILEGKRLGADDYLTKPIDFDLLLATIEARIMQVQRMKAYKETQMVKLYQSLNNRAAENSAPPVPPKATDVRPAQDTVKATSATGSGADVAGPKDRSQIGALTKNGNGTVVAGKFQMLGIDTIKEAMGDSWAKNAERVMRIASDTIKRRLANDDVFEITDDNGILVCFGSLNEQEAAFKAAAISREIQAQILGSSSLDPVMAESFSVASDVHEVALSEGEAGEVDSVVDLIAARLEQAAARARESERAVMDRVIENCDVVPINIDVPEGNSAAVSIADFDQSTRSEIATLQRARPASESLVADLDLLKLGRTAEMLCAQSLDAQPVLLVNVNFSTISNQKLLERYLKIGATLTDAVRNQLALNLGGIPEGYPLARTLSLVHALRRNCRLVTVELSGLSLGNIEPKALQVSIVSWDYQNIGPKLEKQQAAFKRLVSTLREQKVRSLIYGVPKGKDAGQIFQQGVSFVAHRQ